MTEQETSGIEQQSENTGNESSNNVSWESHKKLLNQHKASKSKLSNMIDEKENLMAQLAEYKKKDEERANQVLESKGEYETLNKRLKERLEALDKQEEDRKKSEIHIQKVELFKKALPGDLVNESYITMADLDSIAVHPEEGVVDEISVNEAVDKFVKEHPALVKSRTENKAPLPSKSPTTAANTLPGELNQLSRDELYKKLRESGF